MLTGFCLLTAAVASTVAADGTKTIFKNPPQLGTPEDFSHIESYQLGKPLEIEWDTEANFTNLAMVQVIPRTNQPVHARLQSDSDHKYYQWTVNLNYTELAEVKKYVDEGGVAVFTFTLYKNGTENFGKREATSQYVNLTRVETTVTTTTSTSTTLPTSTTVAATASPNASAKSNKSSSNGRVIGGAVGGAIGGLCVLALVVYFIQGSVLSRHAKSTSTLFPGHDSTQQHGKDHGYEKDMKNITGGGVKQGTGNGPWTSTTYSPGNTHADSALELEAPSQIHEAP